MITLYDDKKSCFGCGACAAACPNGAISMEPDSEGFLYPVPGYERCTECGRCLKVCPAKSELPRREGKFFAVRCSNEDVLKRSASGGAFTLLSQEVLNGGGSVCGAVFDDDFTVRHILSENISPMRKSKYVQSELADCYAQIRDALQQGRTVLFSGTPCQCHAMKKFFPEFPGSLILVSVVCRGVQSPGLWSDYIKYISGDGSLEAYDFRDKRKRNDGHTVSYTADGVETAVSMAEDPLSRLYNLSLTYRPSCYSCPYASADNDFDLTIGDFWGVEKCCPEFADGRGTSLVIAHGERAEDLISRFTQNAQVVPCGKDSALQPALVTPAKEPMLRKFLFRDFARMKDRCENPIPLILKKYGGQTKS